MGSVLSNKSVGDYQFNQPSQIFPYVNMIVDVKSSVIDEDEKFVTYILNGRLNRENFKDKSLEEQYNETYKPILNYKYSMFDYTYHIKYTIEKNSGLLLNGKVLISESVKNNFECITQFEINKIAL